MEGDMHAEDIQRLKQQTVTHNIKYKQKQVGDQITKICEDLQMIRNAVIHAYDYDDTTEKKLDNILERLNKIQNIK